jgi:hypothetical protein
VGATADHPVGAADHPEGAAALRLRHSRADGPVSLDALIS